MKNENKITINESPSKTWSWLKMNKTDFDCSDFYSEKEQIFENQNENVKIEVIDFDNSSAENKKLTLKDSDFSEVCKKFVKKQNLLTVSGNVQNPIVINLTYQNSENSISAQKIVVKENSNVKIIFVYNSEKDFSGQSLISTDVFLENNAKAEIVKVQLLGKNFNQLDDTSFFCEENSKAKFLQIELGGNQVFSSVHTNLLGYKSTFYSDLAYFVENKQNFDFNHVCYQFGKKTDCKMYVDGTLKDEAKKTYRGIIDFKNGCVGSTGDEQESVLVLSPKTVNNSIPVILCDEEDVSGEHGCSIGRLSDDVLFYFESRGISKSIAENIMARAKINAVSTKIQEENVQNSVENLVNQILGEN